MHHVALGWKICVSSNLKNLCQLFFTIHQFVYWNDRMPSGKVLLMARGSYRASIPGWSKAFDRRWIKIKQQIKSSISSFFPSIKSTLLALNPNILFTLTVLKTSISVSCNYLERKRPPSKVQTSTASDWTGVVTGMRNLHKRLVKVNIFCVYGESSSWQCWCFSMGWHAGRTLVATLSVNI